MCDPFRLKEDYSIARCCKAAPPDPIIGYYSYDNILRVHRKDCPNLAKAEADRLVNLSWDDILDHTRPFTPDRDYAGLTETDFAILSHHERVGPDYSLVVARALNMKKDEAFERHATLRNFGLVERVEPRIIQYRKGIVDGKWIKHRNHTYYDLTPKGSAYLAHWRCQSGKADSPGTAV